VTRDLVGYANRKLNFAWPKGKRLAVSIVINFEEGSEHSYPIDGIIEGIGEFLPVDIPVADIGNESSYDYGSRVGIWRILNTLNKFNMKGTFFATAVALQRNPIAAKAIVEAGHEICDHGLRWTEHFRFDYDREKEMIKESVKVINTITGVAPVGFYAREPSQNTIGILEELGGFIYDSDAYSDDIPYRQRPGGILILTYTPDDNDFHFFSPMHRFATASDFFTYLRDTFNTLHEESRASPKMMSVGLHCRISGRPGRIVALRKFLEYIQNSDDVWIAKRMDIAKFWVEEIEPKL
jgi:peptidoglycan/xylan/chitin deacetylase (PgdA/CDA1 family)